MPGWGGSGGGGGGRSVCVCVCALCLAIFSVTGCVTLTRLSVPELRDDIWGARQ